jgi:hypothetical protein
MQKNTWFYLVVAGLSIILIISVFGFPLIFRQFPPPFDRPRFEEFNPEQLRELSNFMALYFKGRAIISSINTILLLYLLIQYIGIYRSTKSNFTLGLILFSFSLLLFSISSNPGITWLTGFQRGNVLQSMNFIPDIFTTIASILLIYLSRQ